MTTGDLPGFARFIAFNSAGTDIAPFKEGGIPMAAATSTTSAGDRKKSRPTTGTGSAASHGGSELGPKRPEFVVVFRERSEKNVSVMADVLKVSDAKGVMSIRASRAVLENNHEWAANPRIYRRLAVAVADLDADEYKKLEKKEEVVAIVKNEIRHVPPIREVPVSPPDAPTPAYPNVEPPSLLERFKASEVELRGADPFLAYATGVRDAADMIVRAFSPTGASHVRPISVEPKQLLGGSSHSWCLALIGLHANYRKATGRGVRVAVLDTGIDLNHPDFAGRFVGGNDTRSFIEGEGVQDENGHGTHCAGVVAGAAQSSGGRRYGVAPDAELIIGKVLSNAGSGYDDQIVEGIDWATDAGAQVISMSLGSARSVGAPYADLYETVAANNLAATPGTLIIAAAGNESGRPAYTAPVGNPAACPSIIAVAAVDRYQRIAEFSCRAMDSIGLVDLSGPGVAVYSSWPGGGYNTISGTSMATPHVAGVAALILELNPTLRATDVWNQLRTLCQPLGDRADFGRGLVQVP